MSRRERLSRLRAVIRELEGAAPSQHRDALLRQARERASALDLGEPGPSAWRSHPRHLSDQLVQGEVQPLLLDPEPLLLDPELE